MIKRKYNDYIEKVNESNNNNLNFVFNLSLEQRKDVKYLLSSIVEGENIEESKLNESLFQGLKDKVLRWLNKKVFTWLINQSEKELVNIIDTLTVLDPSDLSNLKVKPEIIYLGGGIDKTPDNYKITDNVDEILSKIKEIAPQKFKDFHSGTNVVEVERRTNLDFLGDLKQFLEPIGGGGNWRYDIENFFGDDHVVKDEHMENLSKTGKIKKSDFPKPIIVNPLRSEANKRMNPRWVDVYRKWKEGDLEDEEDIAFFKKELISGIVTPDLRMVNICDTNFIRLDGTHGAGTLGEAEMSRFRKQNMFIWIAGGYELSDLSPWIMPGITKLLRSEDEVNILISAIKNLYK